MCLFMEEESLCLTCAATQVVSIHVRINAKNYVTFLLLVHRALNSVKADIRHIMNIVKTTLFLIVYRFSVLLFYPRKKTICPDPEMWGGGGGY